MLRFEKPLKFYQTSNEIGFYALLDFFVSRYGYASLQMDAVIGFEMLIEGYKQAQRNKLYQRFLVECPENVSFNDYCRKFMNEPYRKTTDEEKEEIIKTLMKGD